MSYKCDVCGNSFNSEQGLTTHTTRMHTPKRKKTHKTKYDDETLKWLEIRSTENLFRHFGTDLSTYGRYVKRKLKSDGMVAKSKFTEKAIDIMRGIGLEPVIHIKEEKPNQIFQCPKCDYSTNTFKGLQIHNGTKHRQEELRKLKNNKFFKGIL